MNTAKYEKEIAARATPILDNIRALKGPEYTDSLNIHGALISISHMLACARTQEQFQEVVTMLRHTQATLLMIQTKALAKQRGKGTPREIADEILDDYATVNKQFDLALQNANSR